MHIIDRSTCTIIVQLLLFIVQIVRYVTYLWGTHTMTNPTPPAPEYGTPEYATWYRAHVDPNWQPQGQPVPQRKKHHPVRWTIVAVVALIGIGSGIGAASSGGKHHTTNQTAAATTPAGTRAATTHAPATHKPVTSKAPATHAVKAPATTTAPKPSPTPAPAPKPKPTPKPTPAPKPKPKPAPKPQYATFADGQHLVGQDIQPGTYRAPDATSGCYWERDKDFSGNLDSILANDNPTGPAIVTILPADKGFTSQGCGTWTTSPARASTSTTTITDGTWLVGVDVAPGTYRTSGGDGCYWERENDFLGGLNSIAANANPTGPAVVTISPADKGFTAKDCGTWTRIG